MSAQVGYEKQGGIAVLTIDNPPVNALNVAVVTGLRDRLRQALDDAGVKALVVTGAGRAFIAGADIKGFVGLASPDAAYQMIRQGQQVIDRLAALRCPTVAAINGFALGGGLEVALACRYRVAADDPSVTLGFPEVQLGVHPGLGGTVRAVQLAGPIAAMDLMLTGRHIRDKTGLTGRYDFDMKLDLQQLLAMAQGMGMPVPAGAAERLPQADGASLMTALNEQLGLKLDSVRAEADVLVIDHVEAAAQD